jgi:hypothetical protein
MAVLSGFIVYPSEPYEIGETIKLAVDKLVKDYGCNSYATWEANDIAGRFVVEPILEKIQQVECLVADITKLNFNVTYEIGYAIGRKKRLILVRNKAFRGTDGTYPGLTDTPKGD